MQIVIPMSGFGERFRKVGFKVPKPLIEIDGLHMIGHIVNLFPKESDFLFICNEDHLKEESFCMKEIIKSYCPLAKIIGIKPHKLGPIHAVLAAKDNIDLNKNVIINYCDFSCYWQWNEFKKFVELSNCDGAIPAYKGFHPHSLGSTNYAYLKEEDGLLKDIKEKEPFTSNKINEYASSGTYYFSSGKLMLESLQYVIDEDLNINGEYYVSLAYKKLLLDRKKINIYPLQHFFQWGTPEDLEEYNFWSKTFKLIISKQNNQTINLKGSLIMTMAGGGKRFIEEGYKNPKPFIDVSGYPMVLQALSKFPICSQNIFVVQEKIFQSEIFDLILKKYNNSIIKLIPKPTKGQALTALIGLKKINPKYLNDPITIGSCDSSFFYDNDKYLKLINNDNIDIIVWAARNHANSKRNPEMFGWIDAGKEGLINKISVKKVIKNDLSKPIVVGTFTFKNSSVLEKSIKKMINRRALVNDEFYIDSCINDAISLGYKCHIFVVDYFISWGTPNDLRTFEYWQSAFHKWSYHPYKIDNDNMINKIRISNFKNNFKKLELNFFKNGE